jgi:multidrug efflux system membrane fusion protein
MHSRRFRFYRIADWSASLLLIRAALLAILLGPLLVGCNRPPTEEQAVEPAPRPVRVVEARARTDPRTLRLPGALRAVQRARLAFLNDGYLAERAAAPGDRAQQGQALAVLYNPALQPGVAAAQADVREARTRLEQLEVDTRRQAALVERNLISTDDLDQTRTRRDAARAALEQAEAQLDQARAQLADAALRAPFAGEVTRVFAEPGDFVRAGEPVLALADGTALEAEVQVTPDIADQLATGDAATLAMSASGRRLQARIVEIGRAEPGLPVPVVVRPESNEGIDSESGAPAYVHLEIAGSGAAAVPLSAVIDPGTGYARVFRVVDGRADRVAVLPGRLAGGWIEVKGEITAGDRIVVAGQAHLLDGEPVRALP